MFVSRWLQNVLGLRASSWESPPRLCRFAGWRLAGTTLTPKKVIILEGILLLTDPRLRDLMHATVFMDTPLDICLMRRLQRTL